MAASRIRYHDTTFSPVGLWQLNGDLTDSSGNGYDLTMASGNAHYGDIAPGVKGFLHDGASRIYRSSFTSALAIVGDMTAEMLIVYNGVPFPSNLVILSHDANGESSDTNYLYQIAFTDNPIVLRYFAEFSTGTNVLYTINEVIPQTICHLAMTRASNVIQFYLNGNALGAASTTLTAPSDGSNGRFSIGGDSGSLAPVMSVASVKLIASALTASQVKAEYTRTLGGYFGF